MSWNLFCQEAVFDKWLNIFLSQTKIWKVAIIYKNLHNTFFVTIHRTENLLLFWSQLKPCHYKLQQHCNKLNCLQYLKCNNSKHGTLSSWDLEEDTGQILSIKILIEHIYHKQYNFKVVAMFCLFVVISKSNFGTRREWVDGRPDLTLSITVKEALSNDTPTWPVAEGSFYAFLLFVSYFSNDVTSFA